MDTGGAQGRLEDQRLRPVQVVARPWPATPGCHPRPRLGREGAAARHRRQGTLCMVRRAHRLHQRHARMGADPRPGLETLVERCRYPADPFHRQGQYRVSLHHFPGDAEGGRQLYPARQRARLRVHEFRERQDLHFAQLGRVAARVPGGISREAGRAALRADHQRTRDQGQRLHLEGFPGPQQQRIAGHLRQFCQPHPGAHP